MPKNFVIYLCVTALLTGCASSFVLRPTSDGVTSRTSRRLIEAPSGNVEVFIEHRRGGAGCEPAFQVLEFVGNAGRADWGTSLPSRFVNAAPMDIWSVNYPGYGASEGRARLSSIAPAARAVFDELDQTNGDVPIIVYGYSLGSTAALHLAATRDVTGVILRNPPPLGRIILAKHGWWNLWLAALPVAAQIPRSLWTGRNGRRATAPAVFIMSEEDRVVPVRLQRRVRRYYAGPSRTILMSGAHHNARMPESSARELVSWLRELVGDAQLGPCEG